MGGTGGTTTGGVSTARGGAPPGTGGSTSSYMSNVLNNGTLQGFCYAIVDIDGVETEGDVETLGLEFDYVLPGTSYDDFALVGCNVNQDVSGVTDPPADEVTVATTDQICVAGSGFDRIQIQDSSGTWWCAAPTSTCVPAGDFNTACWDASGEFFHGGPTQQILAMQPSSESKTPIIGTICVADIRIE